MDGVITNWDLKEIIDDLVQDLTEVEAVYLFGSRGYDTGSTRSDIDLLVYSKIAIKDYSLISWLHEKYPPVDVFKTTDLKVAMSVINKSVLQRESLTTSLDAIELWSKDNGFSTSFQRWIQTTDNVTVFKMTSTGVYHRQHPIELMMDYDRLLKSMNLPSFFLGNSWLEVGNSIISIIEKAMDIPPRFSVRATKFSFNTIKLANEYDFQNLVHLLLRPILPAIEPENTVVTIDGNEKKADFGLMDNKIIIELKHIRDASTKAEVIKTLDGLNNFYSVNPNVNLLLFIILYDGVKVDLDKTVLEAKYNKHSQKPPMIIRFINNSYVVV